MAADVTRESQRTKAMAVIGASVGLSFVLAIVLGPVIASAMGLQVFLVTACLGTLGLVIVLTLLPRLPPAALSRMATGRWITFGGRLPVLYGSIFLLHGLMMPPSDCPGSAGGLAVACR